MNFLIPKSLFSAQISCWASNSYIHLLVGYLCLDDPTNFSITFLKPALSCCHLIYFLYSLSQEMVPLSSWSPKLRSWSQNWSILWMFLSTLSCMPSVKESPYYFPFLFQFPLFQLLIGSNFYQQQPPVTPASFKSSLQLNTKVISLKHKSYHHLSA